MRLVPLSIPSFFFPSFFPLALPPEISASHIVHGLYECQRRAACNAPVRLDSVESQCGCFMTSQHRPRHRCLYPRSRQWTCRCSAQLPKRTGTSGLVDKGMNLSCNNFHRGVSAGQSATAPVPYGVRSQQGGGSKAADQGSLDAHRPTAIRISAAGSRGLQVPLPKRRVLVHTYKPRIPWVDWHRDRRTVCRVQAGSRLFQLQPGKDVSPLKLVAVEEVPWTVDDEVLHRARTEALRT